MHLNTVVIAVFCWIDKQGCYLTVFLMPCFLSALRMHVFDAIQFPNTNGHTDPELAPVGHFDRPKNSRR
jgi:hypothetical protein